MKKTAPYGSWPSVITTDLMTAGTIGLSEARIFNGDVYWLESRPAEQGRSVIVRMNQAGETLELLTSDFSCRSRVHEYGGVSFLPTTVGLFFVNHSDQQIYRVDQTLEITKITNAPALRFADLSYNANNSTLIAIAEEHADSLDEPINRLVAVDINDGKIKSLHAGQDFYASASFSPDGKKLSWLSWMHPNMPWDGTSLWQADYVDRTVVEPEVVAGGSEESIFQPEWSPSGELFFVSDKSNWWNIYRLSNDGIKSVCTMDVEFGLPLWQFGMTRYGFIDTDTILTSYSQLGAEKLATINVISGHLTIVERPHSHYGSLRTEVSVEGVGKYCYLAQSAVEFPAVYVGDLHGEKLVCASSKTAIDKNHFSIAESMRYQTADNQMAYGFYYGPNHAEYQGLEGELPPMLVMIHGGPTSASSDSLSLKIQYWTNRGFAVFDVNHRGSTGFGRQYRDALKRQWGVVDVQDCDFGVQYLIERGLVDKDRIAIRGGSAGGFTVLAALAHTESFKAGTSLYGVTDLTALATDTHKFESRYLDSLIGPYPADKKLYEQRSPLSHADSIQAPVLFLQGLDDKVVPPSQAEAMIEGLSANQVPVAYLPFEGEGHGFRKSETITRAFEAELWFYGSVFGFEPDQEIEPLQFI